MNRRHALLLALLAAAALLAYRPAWHGGFLWDDDAHVTRVELRSAEGLRSIWVQPGATQQYYPLSHSAFWILHRVWGDDPAAYHLTNILLHALSAFLLALLLERLGVPGARLAAFIFALHPVHVESVAWITELKNTLSGVFYLAAALVYLSQPIKGWPTGAGSGGRPTGTGSGGRPTGAGSGGRPTGESVGRPFMGRQALALFLFIVALLTKTVTATLPAALLVVFWWQRGKVRWREDVVPLLPFFAVALAAGLTTAWVERNFVGAQGFEFELSPLERVLIAGRAVWFYAGKLAWPSGLTFIYPRWEIDATALWQWAFPAAALVLLFVLWRLRHRSRAPLAAALLFGGTLFPALGFVDVFPFRYSFVADHFQYLASIAPIALFAAAVTAWASPQRHRGTEDSFQERVFSLKNDSLCLCASVVICSSLAFLTWRQSHQYVDAATLYTATLERNPGCWMCHNNLAKLRFESAADRERALAHIDESLRINPRSAEGHHNRGVLLRLAGRHAEALREQQEAVRLLPAYAEAHNELGLELQIAGRPGEALAEYERALQLKPRYAEALANAAEALGNLGRGEEALARVREALAIRPQYAPAHDVLGTLIARSGRIEEALEHFDAAVRLDPANAAAHNDRGTALAALGRNEEAAAEYAEAVRLHPNDAKFQDNLGYLLLQLNRGAEALPHFEAAVAADPGYAPARLNLANVLLAAGRPAEAIPHYERVLQQPGEVDAAQTHNNLGIAYATSGRRAEAIAQFEEALRLRPDFQQARENLLRARGK